VNILGHNYVAKLVLNKYNSEIAAGCHLPDLVPFLKGSTLSFEEIHENPELVYEYSSKHNGVGKDLALGLMTHSVKFGADKFNRDIDIWLLENDETIKQEIAEQISEASNINIDIAKGGRMHNYLWCGLDFYIIDNFPDFLPEMNAAYKNIDTDNLSRILSTIFNKPFDLIREDIKKHIALVINHDIKDKQSFLMFWKDFISDLPDRDDVNLEKALETISFIEEHFNKHWEGIVNRVVLDIKNRMKLYLEN
jgi:hypothetical protein